MAERAFALRFTAAGSKQVFAELDKLGPAGDSVKQKILDASKAIQDVGERSRAAASRMSDQLRANGESAARQVTTVARAAEGAGRNFSAQMGQVGFQVQDFITQVGAGQNAFVAFAQQGGQLAGVLAGGFTGLVVSAAAMAAQFLFAGQAAEKFKAASEATAKAVEALNEAWKATSAAGDRRTQDLGDQIRAMNAMREAVANLTVAEREREEQRQRSTIYASTQKRDDIRNETLDQVATGQLARQLERIQSAREENARRVANGGAARTLDERGLSAVVDAYQALANASDAQLRPALERLSVALFDAAQAAPQMRRELEAAGVAAFDNSKRVGEMDGALDRARTALAALRAAAGDGARGLTDMHDAALSMTRALGDIPRRIDDITARMQALRAGGIAAFEAERGRQQDSASVLAKAAEAEAAYRAQLEASGLTQQQITDQVQRTATARIEAARIEVEKERELTTAVDARRRAESEAQAAATRAASEARQRDERARNATESIQQQVRALTAEAEAMGVSERQRAITVELLKAENAARQANRALTAEETEAVRQAASARYEANRIRQEAERAARESEALMRRPFENAITGIQSAFSDMFMNVLQGGVKSFTDMGRAIKQVFMRLVAEIATLLAFRPIVGGLLGTVGLGGLIPGLGGSAVAMSAGTGTGAGGGASTGGGWLSNLSSVGSLARAGGGGFLAGLTNRIDVFGNAAFGLPLGSAGGVGSTLSVSQLAAAGPALPGQAAAGLLNGGSALGGFALSNVLGIAGAAIPGLISGNYAQAGLGAAGATLGTVLLPGIGTVIGGVAGNLLGGLFGGKKAGFSGGRSNLVVDASGNLVLASYGGKRYDEGALVNASNAAAGEINSFVGAMGLKLFPGGAGKMGVGQGEGARSSFELFRDLASYGVVYSGDRNINTALWSGRAGGSFEEVAQSISFIRDTFNAIVEARRPLTELEQSMRAFADSAEAARAKASSLGLGLDALNAGLTKTFDQQIGDAIRAITDPLGAALDIFDRGAKARLDTARAFGADLVQVEKLNALERARVIEQVLGGTMRSLVDQLTYGDLAGTSPDARYFAGLTRFNTAASAVEAGTGSLADFQAVAQSFLPQARDFLGTSERYQQLVGRSLDVVTKAQPASDPSGVGRAVADASLAGSAAVVDALGEVVSRLDRMAADNARLNAQLAALTARMIG